MAIKEYAENNAYNKCGGAFKMCEEKYKMAEANKAFSHLRF
jgi:hypothetical protein